MSEDMEFPTSDPAQRASGSKNSHNHGDVSGTMPEGSPVSAGSTSLPSLTSIYGLPCFNCPDIDRCGMGLPINPVVCEKISLWLLRVRKSQPITAT